MSLSKGASFHVSSPPPSEDDPVLSIRHLARRSPTCSRSSLQSLISDKEDFALKSIQAFEQTFSGARGKRLSSHRLSGSEEQLDAYRAVSSPLDEGLGSSISPSSEKGLARSFDRILDLVSDKDSGLGTSIDDHLSMKELDNTLRRTSENDGLVQDLIQGWLARCVLMREGDINQLNAGADHPDSTPVHARRRGGHQRRLRVATSTRSAVTRSISPQSQNTQRPHSLTNFAYKKISQKILKPILQEDRFDIFHPLVTAIGSKSNKSIQCLRDLEQSLIFQPLVSRLSSTGRPSATVLNLDDHTKAYHVALQTQLAVSHHLYRTFGEFSIQLVLDTYQHLSEADQRRNTDRPYDSGYFLDLVQQVGRLAAQIGSARQARAADPSQATDDDDMAYSPDDEITLEGGLGTTGDVAELVRWKNGKGTSLRTNERYIPLPGIKRQHTSEDMDDDVARSMARRKKNAEPRIVELKCSNKSCGKIFTRKCDLAKHEKTHSRPFKCDEPSCKYHDLGLPTEKERDRHYNDKHAANPHYYQCNYCEFKTKRESNCKQHMEKKHDWEYERVKGNGRKAKSTPGATPQTPSMDYTPSVQSPAPSHLLDDTSSVHESIAESTFGTPYDQPMQTFEYPPQVRSGMPLFPRPDQQRQFVQATNDFAFETLASMYPSTPHYAVPQVNSQSSQLMRTPITPAYSAISSYGPSPQNMTIQMDYQGMNHDLYISHSQLPDDDFQFNDPIVNYESTMGEASLFQDGLGNEYPLDNDMNGDMNWCQYVNME
jgi:hypothetical protein